MTACLVDDDDELVVDVEDVLSFSFSTVLLDDDDDDDDDCF